MNRRSLCHETKVAFKKMIKLFNTTEEALDADVETIRTWLQTQPHLPEVMDDLKIRNFFIRNKFSIERTKEKIDMYYTIKSLIPDIYDAINPRLPHNKRFMDSAYWFDHQTLKEDLYTLGFLKMKEPNTLAPREIMMLLSNMAEIKIATEWIFSEIYLIDMANITLNDIMKVTPSFAMKIAAIYEKVWSFRIKAVHIFNASPYVSKFLGIVKTVIKTKIFNRIHTYPDEGILKEIFTEDTLPKDYGGNGPSLQELTDLTRMRLEQYRDRFDMLDKLRVDESLRPQKLNNDELLGFYGNFKKLDFD